jgi:hypothetical protein
MAEIVQHRRLGQTKAAEPKKISPASIQTIFQESKAPEQLAK